MRAATHHRQSASTTHSHGIGQAPTHHMMKAVCIKSNNSPMELVNIPKPTKLGHSDVLIKVQATSINPIDAWMTKGYGNAALSTQRTFPWIVGRDCSGVIEDFGDNVWELKKGDSVYCAISPEDPGGCHAEYVVINQHHITHKPKNLSHHEAASIPYAGLTAWNALVSNDILKREGASVLIVGASGGVGTFAIQLLKYLNCKISATCSTKHIELVKSLGCETVYDYTKNERPKENSYDIVLDGIGGLERSRMFSWLKKGGHLVSIRGDLLQRMDERGIMLGGISAFAELLSEKLVQKVALDVNYDWALFRPDKEALYLITKMIEEGAIKPVIDPKKFTLDNTAEAYQYFMDRKSFGKIVIDVV